MGNRFFRKTGAGEIVKKLTVKAVMERSLICEGDRILIAVSGGKDSSVLAWALSCLRPALKINYELAAIHISADFNDSAGDTGSEGDDSCRGRASTGSDGCRENLSRMLEEWGVPFTDIFVPVVDRLKEGKKMNCYWCSTQRRTELLKYAVENGFNKIALGHHLDDIIETFFMNLCSKGTLSAMPILLKYRKYPVSLIRPLALLEEKQIIACAAEHDILKTACTCPYGQNSKRRDMRSRIADFAGGEDSGEIKRRILSALKTGERDYLSEE
ncbi:MAG: tRNA 2-thiocytidine biosynthesis TtcA family protein [Treponema sp.]|jgi:tRNA 2-thiocytidine biosynthesis protein TtcA|nr:tRNA 2-thiocytidine biosynthesis TtcA family protein [Treponema sp.]